MVPSAFYKDRREVLLPCPAISTGALLPSTVIYGPNAAGKSNVINAVEFLRASVVESHILGKPGGGVPRQPFALNSQGAKTPTSLEVEFVLDDVRYQYGFEVDDKAFHEEWLYWFPRRSRQLLFERTDEKTVRFGRSLKGQNRVMAELMRDNSLFLSVAAQNRHDQLSKVHAYIASLKFQTAGSSPTGTSLHTQTEVYDARIIDFLTLIGTGIIGYRTKKISYSEKTQAVLKEFVESMNKHFPSDRQAVLPEEEAFVLELAHQAEGAEPVYFDVVMESAGTRRLLLILSSVFSALDAGTVLFIDELDASLHTQICEGILALFGDPERNVLGAQLIATTHDTNLMRAKYLRRDQLWFTEKDQKGATHLFPLSDIRTRNTDDIEKGYLQGRYGAIPFAGSIPDLLPGS